MALDGWFPSISTREDVPSPVELGWRSGVNFRRRLRQFRSLSLPCRGVRVGAAR